MSEKLYRVCWRSRLTGATGQQGGLMSRPVAERIVKAVSRQHQEIEFWVEESGE